MHGWNCWRRSSLRLIALAAAHELHGAIITESGLKITPLETVVPDAAQTLIDQLAMVLPHIKITEVLMEVDTWTGFSLHFTHLKTGDTAKGQKNAANHDPGRCDQSRLGQDGRILPKTTHAKLSWLQAWHIRDEPYSAALAELANARSGKPLAENWGDGSTSSSDGQRFDLQQD